MRAIFICCLFIGCTTAYYPNGSKALVIGSNIKGLVFRAPGIELRGDFDNAIILQKIGAAISQGAMSFGAAFAGIPVIANAISK